MLFYCILHPTATRVVKMQSYKSYSVYSLFINNNFSPAAATPHSSPIRSPCPNPSCSPVMVPALENTMARTPSFLSTTAAYASMRSIPLSRNISKSYITASSVPTQRTKS